MFGFSGAIKFYYCPTPISMRKSFDGLAGGERWKNIFSRSRNLVTLSYFSVAVAKW